MATRRGTRKAKTTSSGIVVNVHVPNNNVTHATATAPPSSGGVPVKAVIAIIIAILGALGYHVAQQPTEQPTTDQPTER